MQSGNKTHQISDDGMLMVRQLFDWHRQHEFDTNDNLTILFRGILQGEHKKSSPPTTFVDISAIREDFCMKFHRTVKLSLIHI